MRVALGPNGEVVLDARRSRPFFVIKSPPLSMGDEIDVVRLDVFTSIDEPKTVPSVAARSHGRIRAAVDEHYDLVWRSLRRFGVQERSVDDAAQQVLLILSLRIDDIRQGAERPFMLSTAIRVAADYRKKQSRSREVLDQESVEDRASSSPAPDVLIDRERARRLLDVVLDELPDDLRVVFVLFELEELTMATIAETLGLPPGTVASRLRRARQAFEAIVERRCCPNKGYR